MAFASRSILAFTATAFAEGDVCKIGEQGYATLAEAIAAVQAGETITLTQDAEYPGGEWTKSFTLDGEGHTITLAGDTTSNITIKADVTAKNVTFDLNNKANNIKVESNKTLTAESVNVKNGGTKGGKENVMLGGGMHVSGTLNMKDGSITNCYSLYNGDAIFVSGFVTLDGVSITGNGADEGGRWDGAVDINAIGDYQLTLKGNTCIQSNGANTRGVKVASNTTKSDGTNEAIYITVDESFSGTVELYDSRYFKSGESFANIESGKSFTGTIKNMNTNTTLTGIADGDKVFWGTDGECYIGTDKYNRMSFADAVKTGGDITLVKDATYTVSKDLSWEKSINVNGNGHTVKVESSEKVIYVGLDNKPVTAEFSNVTIDLNKQAKFYIRKDSTVTLGKDAVVKNGYTTGNNGNWGGAFNVGRGAALNMTENSVLCDSQCTSNANAVFLSGTLNMSGTSEIKNCASSKEYAAVEMVAATGVINLSGSAKICDNTYGNVWRLYEDAQINITDSFNGKVTFKDGARTQGGSVVNTDENNAAGKVFGVAASGAVVAEGAITCEANKKLYAVVDGTELIWTTDGEAYVGEEKYNRMTLADAVTSVTDGGTINLVKDAEYTGVAWTKSITLEGNSHTLTMKGRIDLMASDKTATFKNLTMTGSTTSYGVVAIGVSGGLRTVAATAVFDNCTITGNSSGAMGVLNCLGKGTFELKNTEVTGNTVKTTGAVCVQYGGTVILSGSTTIKDNKHSNTTDDEISKMQGVNLIVGSDSTLKIQGKLTGSIQFDETVNGRTAFGTAEEGASLSTMETLTRGDAFGVAVPGKKVAIIDGKLTWIDAPSLGDIQTDSGVYTEEDGSEKAVIRAIGKVAAGEKGVEAVGIYVGGSIDEGKAATWKNTPTESMNSKTFAADIYTSDLKTERTVVEYMKIAGVDELITKSATVTVDKSKEIAKPDEAVYAND